MSQILIGFLVLYLAYIFIFAVLVPIFTRPEAFKDTDYTLDFKETAESVVLLDSGPAAWQARIDLINATEETLDIAYFSMPGRGVVDEFNGAVLDAANRGVKVNFLIDGLSNSIWFDTHIKTIYKEHPNLEMRYYHPFKLWYPQNWQHRMHDKMIISDGSTLIYGGRNISDRFYRSRGNQSKSTYDRDIMIFQEKGDNLLIDELTSYFNYLWNKDKNESLNNNRFLSFFAHKAEEYENDLLAAYYSDESYTEKESLTKWRKNSFSINRFIYTQNGDFQARRQPKVWHTLLTLIDEAEKDSIVFSPYIVLDYWMKKDLKEVTSNPIEVSFLTNSMISTNNLGGFAGYVNGRLDLLKRQNIKMYEYMAEHGSLHIKGGVVDSRYSVIGTYNLDGRSSYYCTESVLIIDSPEFTEHLIDSTKERYLDESLLIDKYNYEIPSKNSGFLKKLIFMITRPFAKLIESLL